MISPLKLVPIFKVEFSGHGEDQRNGSTVHFPSFQGFQVLSGVHQVDFFLQKKLNQESQQIDKNKYCRFECEIENYSSMEHVLAKLDMKTVKLSGFQVISPADQMTKAHGSLYS